MADHFDDFLTWYRVRWFGQKDAGSNIAAKMQENYTFLVDTVFLFRSDLQAEQKGLDWRVNPVCYGRCIRCASNWSTGSFNIDACGLCHELYAAMRQAEQINRKIWLKVSVPGKPAANGEKPARRWLSWDDTYGIAHPLQLVVWVLEVLFALVGVVAIIDKLTG